MHTARVGLVALDPFRVALCVEKDLTLRRHRPHEACRVTLAKAPVFKCEMLSNAVCEDYFRHRRIVLQEDDRAAAAKDARPGCDETGGETELAVAFDLSFSITGNRQHAIDGPLFGVHPRQWMDRAGARRPGGSTPRRGARTW